MHTQSLWEAMGALTGALTLIGSWIRSAVRDYKQDHNAKLELIRTLVDARFTQTSSDMQGLSNRVSRIEGRLGLPELPKGQ